MSSSPSPTSGQPPTLETATAQLYSEALRALQQHRYNQAVEYFQQVYQQTSVPAIYRLKVTMGLIRAHQGLGQWHLVQRLCQPLLAHRSLQVRQWAIQVVQACPAAPGDHPQSPSKAVPPPVPGQSLFHYQQLNRQVGGAVDRVQPELVAGSSFTPLALPQRLLLYGLQAITAIAGAWLIIFLVHSSLRSGNRLIRAIPWPVPLSGLPALDRPQTALILSVLLALALASPWLMDWMLGRAYGQHSLPLSQLQRDHPQALRLLRRVCQGQGWALPPLRLLPVTTPLCFSYGWWGRHSRLVVSQGLLTAIGPQTLATLVSYELAHRANGDLPVMSTLGLLLLGCHGGYCRLAAWGDRQVGLGRWLLVLAAAGCYGGFWLLRQLALGLSRLRSRLCDRQVLALSQDPTALSQSLIDLTLALVRDVQQQGALHPLGLALEVLMPLSVRSALSPGSFLSPQNWPALTPDALFQDDRTNPYRYWLQANSSHPPLGERVQGCQGYIQHRQDQPPGSSPFSVARLLGQKSPLVGLCSGGVLVLALGLLARILNTLGWYGLNWVYQDPNVLKGGLLLGLGLGMLLRINPLYPAISSRRTPRSDLETILVNRPIRLPVEGQPVCLEATLIGAAGLANGLAQQYYLNWGKGLIKLAFTPPQMVWLGLGNSPYHPQAWLGRKVQVMGWGRRAGGHFWIDVAHLQASGQSLGLQDHGPLWSSLVSLGLSLAGLLIIFTGK